MTRFFGAVCLILALSLSGAVASQPDRTSYATEIRTGDYVVLMHGIGRSPAAMKKMEADLRRRGYDVLNLGYDSRKYAIEDLAEKMHPAVESFATDPARKLHFVGHSMGALVIRAYAEKYKPQNMGRVVALGSPNGGSEVADFLNRSGLYGKFYGPAGQELTTPYRVAHPSPKPFYEIGTIAGDRTIDPLSSFIIPGDDDGKVSIASTRIAGEKDHIVLHANHATMPSNAAVIIETAHFLQYGFFRRAGIATH